MKCVYVFPIVCALGLAALLANAAEEAKPITVTMKSLSYDPKTLEVHVGDSVMWTNSARTKHTATSDDATTFDTGEIEPGKSSNPVKFDKQGEFKYHCKVHGKAMSGSIVVKGG